MQPSVAVRAADQNQGAMRVAPIATAPIDVKHIAEVEAAPAFGRADFHGAHNQKLRQPSGVQIFMALTIIGRVSCGASFWRTPGAHCRLLPLCPLVASGVSLRRAFPRSPSPLPPWLALPQSSNPDLPDPGALGSLRLHRA